jgi:hypothetical protein
VDAVALVAERGPEEERGLLSLAFQLACEVEVDEPVAVHADQGAAEGGLDGGEREIDVELAETGDRMPQ